MPTRFRLVAASLFTFATACTDDAAPAAPDRFAAHAPHAEGIEPGARPDVREPDGCITAGPTVLQFGTTAHDEVRDLAVAADGTLLAAGVERGALVFASLFNTQGFVTAYSADLATVERRATLDGTGTYAFESVAIAPDTGRVWLAARTNADLPGVESRGNFDLVVGELAAAGGFTPLARGFDAVEEQPRQLAVAPGGRLAVAGEERRLIGDNTTTLNPWFATFTASATGVAPRAYASRQRAELEAYRAVDVSETMVVVGGRTSDGADQGMFVETYDHDVARGWRRQLSSVRGDAVVGVELTADGDVVFAATVVGQLGDVQHGGVDVVVGRLDGATGATEWITQLGTAADDLAADLALDRDGRIHVVGTLRTATAIDAFLTVLDADGALLLDEAWSSDGNDIATAVAVDSCGTIVVGGSTTGDLGGASSGVRDAFLAVTRLAR